MVSSAFVCLVTSFAAKVHSSVCESLWLDGKYSCDSKLSCFLRLELSSAIGVLLCVSKLSFSCWLFPLAAPIVAPNFTVEDTSADSILVKWEDIPVEELRGFLRGYLFYFEKGERDTSKMRGLESGKLLTKVTTVLPRSSQLVCPPPTKERKCCSLL